MKRLTFLVLGLGMALSSCSNPTEVPGGFARLEATVRFYPSEVAVGGEVDPSGFILTDATWQSPAPNYPFYRIYAAGRVDSSMIGHRIAVSGVYSTILCNGVERGTRRFPLVDISGVTVLE